MNKVQKKMLLEDGFLPSEVRAFTMATGGNVGAGDTARHIVKQKLAFNSKPFLAMRRSRRRYINDLKKVGWSDLEIKTKILDYYRLGAARSPWDWLKLEYKPAKMLSDFQDAVKRRIRSRASRTLGKLYGRKLKDAAKARSIPKRPVIPTRPRRRIIVRRTSRRPPFGGR